jgi:hypothetical protein
MAGFVKTALDPHQCEGRFAYEAAWITPVGPRIRVNDARIAEQGMTTWRPIVLYKIIINIMFL